MIDALGDVVGGGLGDWASTAEKDRKEKAKNQELDEICAFPPKPQKTRLGWGTPVVVIERFRKTTADPSTRSLRSLRSG